MDIMFVKNVNSNIRIRLQPRNARIGAKSIKAVIWR